MTNTGTIPESVQVSFNDEYSYQNYSIKSMVIELALMINIDTRTISESIWSHIWWPILALELLPKMCGVTINY